MAASLAGFSQFYLIFPKLQNPPELEIFLLDTGDSSRIELFNPLDDTPAMGDPATNDPVLRFALATIDTHAAIEHVRQAGYEIIEFFQTR